GSKQFGSLIFRHEVNLPRRMAGLDAIPPARLHFRPVLTEGTTMAGPRIHPTAIIDARAEIPSDAQIGPHVVIEGAVKLGPRTVIRPQAHLIGPLVMGEGNDIGTGAVIG